MRLMHIERMPLRLLGGLLLAIVAVAGWQWLRREAPPPAPEVPEADTREAGVVRYPADAPQLSAIRVETVQPALVPVAEPFNARIAYDEDATARLSAPIAGRVVALRAQIGDPVRAGDVLAVLDAPELGEAQADLRKARADDDHKRRAADRARALLAGGVIAQREEEDALADAAQAQAELARAQLRLANLQLGDAGNDGERYALRAPFAGIVAERHLNPGAEVQPDPQNPLFVVTDPRRLWAIVDLPEAALARVRPGQTAELRADALPDQPFAARVDRIAPVLDATTRRITVICRISNPDGVLRPEMFARVSVSADGATALRVPNAALLSEGVYTRVFVQDAPGVFRKRSVTLAAQDRDFSYVSSGLAAGDAIVTGGAILLNNELAASE
jgi:cobalt-zinc-cadmium efflux system membrane fusion protein